MWITLHLMNGQPVILGADCVVSISIGMTRDTAVVRTTDGAKYQVAESFESIMKYLNIVEG